MRKAAATCVALITSVAVLLLLNLLPAASGGADVYRWQDDRGVWHFSDRPTADASGQRIVDPPLLPIESSDPDGGGAGGLFWRIVKAGTRPSYLLGTLHVADPRVTRLRPAVEAAFERADTFAMEAVLDGNALMTLGSAMLLPEAQDLESLVGSRLFARAVEALTEYGLSEAVIRRFKPWAVMALLGSPKPSGGPILDMALYQRALARGIEVQGLESVQEQVAVFEALSLKDQRALLSLTIEHLETLPSLFEQLIEAYATDDLSAIAAFARTYQDRADLAAFNRFMFQLNDERNQRMAQRLEPILKEGNVFVAVGALHLAGPRGVIQLLRNRGYGVEPVP